jgi:hypothetical protein
MKDEFIKDHDQPLQSRQNKEKDTENCDHASLLKYP